MMLAYPWAAFFTGVMTCFCVLIGVLIWAAVVKHLRNQRTDRQGGATRNDVRR